VFYPPGVATADGGAIARLRVEPDWRETLEGQLVAGGRLSIEYTAERRHQLFGARMAGAVVAYAVFAPGGERHPAVRRWRRSGGRAGDAGRGLTLN
jgi:hypothetical protein